MEKMYTYQTKGKINTDNDNGYGHIWDWHFPWFVFNTLLNVEQMNKAFRHYIYKHTKENTIVAPLHPVIVTDYQVDSKRVEWNLISNWKPVEMDILKGNAFCDYLNCAERIKRSLGEKCSKKCPFGNLPIKWQKVHSTMTDPEERYFDAFCAFGADNVTEYKTNLLGHKPIDMIQLIKQGNPFQKEKECPFSVDFNLYKNNTGKRKEAGRKAGFTRHNKSVTCPKCVYASETTSYKHTFTTCELYSTSATSRDERCWKSWKNGYETIPHFCSKEKFNKIVVQQMKDLGGIQAIRSVLHKISCGTVKLKRARGVTGCKRLAEYTLLPHITVVDGKLVMSQNKLCAVRTAFNSQEMQVISVEEAAKVSSLNDSEEDDISLDTCKMFAASMWVIILLAMRVNHKEVDWGSQSISLKYRKTNYCGMGKFDFRLRGVSDVYSALRLHWDTTGRYDNFTVENYTDLVRHIRCGNWSNGNWPEEE